MRACELEGFAAWLKTSPLEDDRLWSRPLSQVSELEIQLFYARAGLAGMREDALQAIDRLQSALLLGAMDGKVDEADLRIISHEVPSAPYTVDEFVDRLMMLSLPRRMAVLFALVNQATPEQVVQLEWRKSAALSQVKPLAREILAERAKVRHLRLPYVFWEWATNKIAAPLLNLRQQTEEVFGEPWPAIQARWTDMIWIDTRSDVGSFMSIVGEVRDGKI